MTDRVFNRTASELLSGYASKQFSPDEVVADTFEHIATVDPALNAVILPLQDSARSAAAQSTARWAAGTQRPLEGIPYGLKDIIATAGIRTTGGSALFIDNVPAADATVARRLAEAGGILIGKLHTFEFASGGAENRALGICRNPWDIQRGTGGSSSGSASAVAAAEVSFALGTDTGGSVRIPAAYCGIVALKPTFGRVPRTGVMPLSWSLDHVGPMTRSVADAALVLQAIAGYDESDATCSSRPVPSYVAGSAETAEGLKLGRPRGWFEDSVEPSVLAPFDRACGELADLGVQIVDVALPDAQLWDAAAWCIIYAEMLSLHQEHVGDIEHRDAMGAGMLSVGPFIHAVDYLRALRYRSVAQRQLSEAMSGLAGLITPSVTTVAPPLDTISSSDDSARWLAAATRMSTPFNLTGVPALSMPIGFVDSLPVSMQIITRPHDELTALRLGRHYEQHTAYHQRQPALVGGAG
ncbi:amidase [Jatrophihabitans sp. DSM 45814]